MKLSVTKVESFGGGVFFIKVISKTVGVVELVELMELVEMYLLKSYTKTLKILVTNISNHLFISSMT